jgi:hypothetical protein
MSAAPAISGLSVSAEHPWLGLAPFTEDVCSYFYGRETEVEEAAASGKPQTLTVFFENPGGQDITDPCRAFPQLRRGHGADFCQARLRACGTRIDDPG